MELKVAQVYRESSPQEFEIYWTSYLPLPFQKSTTALLSSLKSRNLILPPFPLSFFFVPLLGTNYRHPGSFLTKRIKEKSKENLELSFFHHSLCVSRICFGETLAIRSSDQSNRIWFSWPQFFVLLRTGTKIRGRIRDPRATPFTADHRSAEVRAGEDRETLVFDVQRYPKLPKKAYRQQRHRNGRRYNNEKEATEKRGCMEGYYKIFLSAKFKGFFSRRKFSLLKWCDS